MISQKNISPNTPMVQAWSVEAARLFARLLSLQKSFTAPRPASPIRRVSPSPTAERTGIRFGAAENI